MIQQLDTAPCAGTVAQTRPTDANVIRQAFLGPWGNQYGAEEVQPLPVPHPTRTIFDSFLLGASALADDADLVSWLRPGSRLLLHATGGSRVEVRAPDGRILGRLPPEDGQVVATMMNASVAATARVRSVVPAFQRPRVQLSIELEALAA